MGNGQNLTALLTGDGSSMAEKEKVVLSWSGGKDSALALYELHRAGRYQVVSLFTTVAEQYDRISHHGARTELRERQASALGLPLEKLYISVTSPHPRRTDGSL